MRFIRPPRSKLGAAKQGAVAMREDIYWVGAFKVKPEQFDDFRQAVAPLVAATKQEPGALAYEYNVSEDRSTIHILEHYRDSNAVVSHVQQTSAKFADRVYCSCRRRQFCRLWHSPTG